MDEWSEFLGYEESNKPVTSNCLVSLIDENDSIFINTSNSCDLEIVNDDGEIVTIPGQTEKDKLVFDLKGEVIPLEEHFSFHRFSMKRVGYFNVTLIQHFEKIVEVRQFRGIRTYFEVFEPGEGPFTLDLSDKLTSYECPFLLDLEVNKLKLHVNNLEVLKFIDLTRIETLVLYGSSPGTTAKVLEHDFPKLKIIFIDEGERKIGFKETILEEIDYFESLIEKGYEVIYSSYSKVKLKLSDNGMFDLTLWIDHEIEYYELIHCNKLAKELLHRINPLCELVVNEFEGLEQSKVSMYPLLTYVMNTEPKGQQIVSKILIEEANQCRIRFLMKDNVGSAKRKKLAKSARSVRYGDY